MLKKLLAERNQFLLIILRSAQVWSLSLTGIDTSPRRYNATRKIVSSSVENSASYTPALNANALPNKAIGNRWSYVKERFGFEKTLAPFKINGAARKSHEMKCSFNPKNSSAITIDKFAKMLPLTGKCPKCYTAHY